MLIWGQSTLIVAAPALPAGLYLASARPNPHSRFRHKRVTIPSGRRGFAPGAGKGAVPEAPRFACAPAALILARTTPILAEGQGFGGPNPFFSQEEARCISNRVSRAGC